MEVEHHLWAFGIIAAVVAVCTVLFAIAGAVRRGRVKDIHFTFWRLISFGASFFPDEPERADRIDLLPSHRTGGLQSDHSNGPSTPRPATIGPPSE